MIVCVEDNYYIRKLEIIFEFYDELYLIIS